MSDTQKHTKPNFPNLRFPGFSGEWEESTFGDCCTGFDYGMNAASKQFDGKHKYIRITDIDENTSEYRGDGVVSPDTEIDEHYRVKENDILFARTGASTGKTYLYDPKDGRLYYAGFLIRMNVSPRNDSRFVFYQTQTPRYKKWVQIMSMRSGQPGINSQEYSSYRCFLPKLEEQQKIAKLLTIIDQRISIQNKVIEKYESLIKALCHNLIISFNGTVCHIGDILKIGSGKDYKHLTAGSIPVFGTGGYMLSVSDWLYDGESVCIGRKGTINNPFYVDGKFWTVDTLFYTYDFEGVLPKYCYYLFQTIDWLQYNEASGVPSLSKKTIERIQISIPSIDEQAKAVQVLDRVEMAITCWRELLNHDKAIKQYLLSQLFI